MSEEVEAVADDEFGAEGVACIGGALVVDDCCIEDTCAAHIPFVAVIDYRAAHGVEERACHAAVGARYCAVAQTYRWRLAYGQGPLGVEDPVI